MCVCFMFERLVRAKHRQYNSLLHFYCLFACHKIVDLEPHVCFGLETHSTTVKLKDVDQKKNPEVLLKCLKVEGLLTGRENVFVHA